MLLAGSVIGLLGSAAGIYGMNRNAYHACDEQPRPPGAVPFEGGYAGHGTTVFPVAGVECRWNAIDGGTFVTLAANFPLTAVGWVSFACALVGFAMLVVATVVANQPARDARAAGKAD